MNKNSHIYPGQRNAVRMTLDFHFSPPNTVREQRYKFSLKLNMRMEHLPMGDITHTKQSVSDYQTMTLYNR